MNKTLARALVFLSIAGATVGSGNAQDSASPVFQMVNALKEQQTQLADNQNKIDGKIADLTETIRVARIYMSRAVGKHKPKSKP